MQSSANTSTSDYAYCQDNSTGVLYLHGDGTNFANMDVDCDGLQGGPVDGRCGSSQDTQSETAFKSTVQKYSKANGDFVKDLNANFIPYVVFGNYGSKAGYTTFDPQDHSVKPLSIMAVVCGDQLVSGNVTMSRTYCSSLELRRSTAYGATQTVTMASLSLAKSPSHSLRNVTARKSTVTMVTAAPMYCTSLFRVV